MWFDADQIRPGWTWIDSAYLAAILFLLGFVAWLTFNWQAWP